MGKLIYTAIASLDGFVEDTQGKFDWAEPKEDVHTFINQLEDRNKTMLYGRKLYETMVAWESEDWLKDLPGYIQDYGRIWRSADKIVYSRTLKQVASSKTAIKSAFDAEEIKRMKDSLKTNIGIGGAELAGVALSYGLVDEIYLFLHPVVVGAGKPAFAKAIGPRLSLENTQRFEAGVVLLHYKL